MPRPADTLRGVRGWERLTPAEREVVAMVGEGLTNREIAQERVVSVRTVETHVNRIVAKLGLRSRRQLAQEIIRSRSGGR